MTKEEIIKLPHNSIKNIERELILRLHVYIRKGNINFNHKGDYRLSIFEERFISLFKQLIFLDWHGKLDKTVEFMSGSRPLERERYYFFYGYYFIDNVKNGYLEL